MRAEDLDRLEHILEAASGCRVRRRGRRGVPGGADAPGRDHPHNLEIIGEAVSRLSPELREAQREVPWADVIGHRNVLIHDYRRLIHGLIRRVVAEELPQMTERVRAIVASGSEGE